jgi:hypothetical protein
MVVVEEQADTVLEVVVCTEVEPVEVSVLPVEVVLEMLAGALEVLAELAPERSVQLAGSDVAGEGPDQVLCRM